MDCSIVPTRFPGLYQVSTTDFFFPLVEDPYLQGMIACANVLSDLYALGVVHCDNLLMLLGVSRKMTPGDADIVTRQMMKGFNDQAIAGHTKVTGGQTTRNEWPLIGGVAMATAMESDFIRPELAVPGDVLVLTKPLGIQVAVNVHQMFDSMPAKWQRLNMDSADMPEEKVKAAFAKACESMARLNRHAAMLMHKYHAHGATDVTGFGLLGHADNLAKNQKEAVDLLIDRMPIIADMTRVDQHVGYIWNVKKGRAAETSGGLLIAMPPDAAQQFVDEIQALDGQPAWIIGRVVPGSRVAVIPEDVEVLEI